MPGDSSYDLYKDIFAIALKLPGYALELASILHLTLLVFLRFLSVRNPLSMEKGLVKIRSYLLAAI